MRELLRILWRLYLLLLIISPMGYLFAQEQKEQKETRDPFLSIDDKIKLAKDPVDITKLAYPISLNGIIWTEKVQIAIINNEPVEKNQVWRDFKVEDIQKDRVILKLGNRRFDIPLQLEKNDEQKKN